MESPISRQFHPGVRFQPCLSSIRKISLWITRNDDCAGIPDLKFIENRDVSSVRYCRRDFSLAICDGLMKVEQSFALIRAILPGPPALMTGGKAWAYRPSPLAECISFEA